MNKKIKDLINFINASPSSYHAIENVYNEIVDRKENFDEEGEIKKGNTYVFTLADLDGATLVAIDIGEKAEVSDYAFSVIASHADSPWFKVKDYANVSLEGFNIIPTQMYGGPVLSTWYDRPLTLAGMVQIKDEESFRSVYLKDKTFMIPNLCKHFSRFVGDERLIKNGNPIIGSKTNFKDMLAAELGVKEEDIENFSLNTITKEAPIVWGDEEEYLSASRLDDLASVYTSLEAFLNSHNEERINVLYISDNEEIGSNTQVGAFGSFLKDCLVKVANDLHFDFDQALEKSFMVSSDNAQGVNPYYSYVFNPDYKVFVNQGVGIKNSERYSTTPETQKIFEGVCKKAKVPYQIFYNRKDIRGGGTIGKIVQKNINIDSVDIGVPELAMHSCFETMGTKDIIDNIKLFKYFYNKFKK